MRRIGGVALMALGAMGAIRAVTLTVSAISGADVDAASAAGYIIGTAITAVVLILLGRKLHQSDSPQARARRHKKREDQTERKTVV